MTWLTHMKITMDISDQLLHEAKREAARQGTTLKEVVETALRRLLDDVSNPATFELRDGSIDGHGAHLGVKEGEWECIRGLTYEGRGV